MVRMTRSISCLFLAIFASALLLGAPAQAGNPGEDGFLSLRMPVGARESGMWDAGVASSHGAAAIFWNPANNVFRFFDTTLMVQHYRYVGLMNQEAAALAHRVGNGVIGVIFMGLYSDEIQRRSGLPIGVDEGTYKPYDVALGVSYARPLGSRSALGMNVKLVYERIDIYSDTGIAYDFFFSHKALIEGMIIGASLTNFGKQMNLYNQPFNLPTASKVGIAYTPAAEFLGERVSLASDLFIPQDTSAKVHVGGEYRVIPEFSLRLGSKINYDLYGFTAGFGVKIQNIQLDYAYQDMVIDDFEVGHKFSLNLLW